MESSDKIRELNDTHRHDIPKSKTAITKWVNDLWQDAVYDIIQAVRYYRDFNKWNNPYNENDMWSFMYKWNKIFWKIDYFDKEYRYWSENPSDPKVTWRLLTIMLSEEY